MGDLHVGTSSCSSEDWVGPFYPEGTAPKDFLPHYATKYDTVEVDSTFYRRPTSFLCRKWLKDTPENFRFALKVTRDITHDKVLEGCEEEWEKFLGERERIEKITTKWDKVVIDLSKEMAEWAPLVRRFLAKKVPTYAYFNNHYAGHAPASIAKFMEMLNL